MPDKSGAGERVSPIKHLFQILPCIASRNLRHLLRRSCGDHRAALVAAFRAEVDDVVGRLDHVKVMFDDEHGISLLNQPIENHQQFLDIIEVQTGGRLVQKIQRAAGVASRQFRRESYALGFAA